jgi:hypothetical protein
VSPGPLPSLSPPHQLVQRWPTGRLPPAFSVPSALSPDAQAAGAPWLIRDGHER